MSIGTKRIEDFVPVVKYNEGIYSELDIYTTGNLTVLGTTNIAAISLTDLTVSGNTVIGNAASDTLAVTGVSTFTAAATTDAVNVVGTAITTGKAIEIVDLAALTSGIGLVVTSAATAITGAGRLIFSSHSGATTTSGILNEFASAATDETVIVKVTASGALAAGRAVVVSAAAMTTGVAVSIPDLDGLTTGSGISAVSNSADATARNLVFVHNDHASAVGAVPVAIRNDAPVTTNFRRLISFSNGTVTNTLWMGDGATSPNTALSGTAGDWLIGGDSGKGYFCTGTTNWTAFA